jgi:hypothetical protein
LIGKEGGKTGFPVSNGLVRELKAALQEHLGEIPHAQLIPESPQHDEQDEISGLSRKLNGVSVHSLKIHLHPEQWNVR